MHRYKFVTGCIIAFFLINVCNTTFGQEIWAAYSQKLDVKKYEGRRFRLNAAVRTEGTDDSSASMLWARVDKVSGQGFFNNMRDRPVRAREWKTYSIEGTIDTGATQIAFGALCAYNGKFYFDDFKVEIETQKGKWTNIFVDDFENGSLKFQPGIGIDTFGINHLFKAELLAGSRKPGPRSLVISADKVHLFGNDKRVGKFANVNGIRLYYEIYGSGAPLLVLHGNGGSIESAGVFYNELMKKYKVIAVDSRAQGKSTDTEAPLTYDQMASDVNALLEELKIDSAYIWGQSDGAILGLLLAKDYPSKVKKVVAFGSNIQQDSLALFPWAITAMEKLVKESKDPVERKLNQLMLDYPKIPYTDLASIKAPVLVVAGDRDVIRPEHSLKIFQHIPNSQMCIIPGATHGAAWEKHALFLQIIEDFFDKPFTMPDTKSWF